MNHVNIVDDILIRLWNDLANRQANTIIFKESMDILAARSAILHLIESARQDLPPSPKRDDIKS